VAVREVGTPGFFKNYAGSYNRLLAENSSGYVLPATYRYRNPFFLTFQTSTLSQFFGVVEAGTNAELALSCRNLILGRSVS